MASIQDIEELHNRACEKEEMTYIDPNTGLTVFTKLSHLSRGQCCGCGCRHCPWKSKTNDTTNKTLFERKRKILSTQRPEMPVRPRCLQEKECQKMMQCLKRLERLMS
jgi:hypothetical protein